MRGLAALAITAALVVTGCATVPPAPAPVTRPGVVRDAFDLSGRLSVSRGREGFSGSFRWIATPAADRLELATPLGQIVARLESNGTTVRYVGADGRADEAESWEALTERALGWPLPVAGLRYWVQGAPRPRGPFESDGDALGRVAALRQDGWQVVYRYRQEEEGDVRPHSVRLAYQDLDVRLVIDRSD